MDYDANIKTDRTAETVRALADSGWELRSEVGGFLRFARRKTVSMPLIIAGIVLIPFHDVGILLILVALLNYALAKEPVLIATRGQLAAGKAPISGRKVLSPLSIGLLGIAAFILAGDLIYRVLR